MQRSSFVFLLVSLLATCCFAQQQHPNIITIVTDDQAMWTLGCYGNNECKTPNMDRLAREGARFTNAFVVTPVCSPSRASFLTGRYGTELHITDWINNIEAKTGIGLPDVPTWPKVLQDNGYVTALIGKWHLGEQPQFHPTRHGFTHFYGFLGGGQFPMDPEIEVDGKVQKLKGPIADLLTDDALKFVESNATKPFAMCLMFREPHQPYGPVPAEDSSPYEGFDPTIPKAPYIDPKQVRDWTRQYYAAIHAADRNIGRLLTRLDELKLTANTIVLFTSDHGYCIGQHTLHTKGNAAWIAGGVEGPKRPNMFEENVRVPLIIRGPGIKPGGEIADTVTNLDTFATLLGAVKIPMPADVKQHGVDFSPLLRGESVPKRNEFFGQYDLHNGGFASMRMIRTDQWKLIRHQLTNGLNELYNLESDPGEKKNLYYQHSEATTMRDELQEKLTAWQKSLDDPILKNPLNTPGVGGVVREVE